MATIKRKRFDEQMTLLDLVEKQKNTAHYDMCLIAEKWLKSIGCGVVFRDGFKAFTCYGEQPDALGFRSGVSILIEVKVSRADFLADAKKLFRSDPSKGMGDWRFYMCPEGIIKECDLPEGWGLLYVDGKGKVKRIFGVPGNSKIGSKSPFDGHKKSENAMMYSALRRLVIRGHFETIYDGIQTL